MWQSSCFFEFRWKIARLRRNLEINGELMKRSEPEIVEQERKRHLNLSRGRGFDDLLVLNSFSFERDSFSRWNDFNRKVFSEDANSSAVTHESFMFIPVILIHDIDRIRARIKIAMMCLLGTG